jgi:FkbM family methyltransferase
MTPREAVSYMEPMFRRLLAQGIEIKTLLDVGANNGHFSGFFEEFYPETKITTVECNERNAQLLAQYDWDNHYICVGEKPCTKKFYIDRAVEISGGDSFYREDTRHYDDAIVEEKEIVTLDDYFEGEQFDFVKMDTQGSELDILRGGEKLMEGAEWLMLELSFVPYNKGAPLIDDVLAYTREHGWRMYDTFGPVDGGHMLTDKQKLQVDVLFKKCREDDCPKLLPIE